MRKIITYSLSILMVTIAVAFAFDSGSLDDKTMEQKEKEANELWEEGEYAKAATLYENLLGNEQGNYEYRFRYGACLLYSDSDKKKGLNYLMQCQGQTVSSSFNFFMGKAYHLNYQFNNAIKYYQKFLTYGDAKEVEKLEGSLHLQQAKNGKTLMKTVTDIAVLDKTSAPEETFYDYYGRQENIEGSIINARGLEELDFKGDKKKEYARLIHVKQSNEVQTIYYTSYGPDGNSGKDIYKVNKLPNGEWADPQIVRGPINTKYDEDYAYMDPAGQYLYFSSKGHNSMGGYDVFRSYLNPETGQFEKPENLDFAVNTPGDDIMYIVDVLGKTAIFASDRESPEGNVDVYKVNVERYPVLMVIIKGKFDNKIHPNIKNASIKIKDNVTNEIVGTFTANSQTGEYLITLPKSGKYTFYVESEKSEYIHEGEVTVPYQRTIRALPQDMILFDEGAGEQLKIVDRFNEEVPDNDDIVSQVLKSKAKLNPNADEFKDVEPIKVIDTADIKDVSYEDLTDEQLLDLVKEDEEELKKNLDDLKGKRDAAYAVANTYYEKAKDANEQANQALQQAANATNEDEKQQYLDMAHKLNEEAKSYNEKAIAANNVAINLDTDVEQAENDWKTAVTFSEGIQAAVASNSLPERKKKFEEQKEFITQVISKSNSKNSELDRKLEEFEEKDKLATNAEKLLGVFKDDEQVLIGEIASLESELENAKKKDKEGIQERIDAKKKELSDLRKTIRDQNAKAIALRTDADKIGNELDIMAGTFNEFSTSAITDEQKASLKEKLANNGIQNDISSTSNQIDDPNSIGSGTGSNDLPEVNDISDVASGYQTEIDDINNGSGTDAEKAEQRKGVNEAALDKVNEEIQSTQAAIDAGTGDSDKLNERLDKLNDIKSDIESDIAVDNQKIAQAGGTSTGDLPEVNDISDVASGYQTEIDDINNGSGTDAEKAEQRKGVNEAALDKVNQEIESTQAAIDAGTGDPDKLNERLDKLNDIKSDIESDIAADNQTIAQAGGSSTSDLPEVNDISDVASGYQTEIDDINNGSGTDAEKAEQRKGVNEAALDKVNQEIQSKQAAIDAGTGDSDKLNERLDKLNDIKSDIESDIAADNQTIAQAGGSSTGDLPEVNDISDVASGYQTEIDDINNGSGTDAEKAEQRKGVNEAALDKVNQEIESTQAAIDAGTGDPDKLNERLDKLNDIKSDIESDIAADNQTIAQAGGSSTGDLPEVNDISDVASGYQTEIDDINNGSGTDAEKAEQRKGVNEAALDKVNQEIQSTQLAIDAGTGDSDKLNERLDKLNDIKSDIESNLAIDNETIAQAANSESRNGSISFGDLDGGLFDRYNQTKASELSPSDKAQELAAINQEFLDIINRNIQTKKAEIADNPENDELKKELQALYDLKDQAQRDLDNNLSKVHSESGTSDIASQRSYTNDDAQETADKVKKNQSKLEDINNDIAKQEELVNNTEPGKEKDKAIDKLNDLKDDKADLEVRIATDLDAANTAEFKDAESKMTESKAGVPGSLQDGNPDYDKAMELESSARADAAKADQLRVEAKNEKDPQRKRNLAVQADALDQSATKKMRQAQVIYDGMQDDFYVKGQQTNPEVAVVDDVAVIGSQRKSSEIESKADDYIDQAKELEMQQAALRAEAAGTKKKKTRKALIEQADAMQADIDEAYAKAARAEKAAEQIEEQEKEWLAREEKRSAPKDLSTDKTNEILSYPEYENYFNTTEQAAIANENLLQKQDEIEQKQNEINQQKKIRRAIQDQIIDEQDPGKQDELKKELEEVESDISAAESELEDLETEAIRYQTERDEFLNAGDEYLATIPKDKADDIKDLTGTKGQNLKKPRKAIVVDPDDENFKMPEVLTSNIFKASDNATTRKTITENPKGLVYKVQVGAFRNRIPDDLFAEFAPISEEVIEGRDIKRYMVGYFVNFNSANSAKDEIQDIPGYGGSFVVAYLDGKRISINEARAYEQNNGVSQEDTFVAGNQGTNQNGGQNPNSNGANQNPNNGGNTQAGTTVETVNQGGQETNVTIERDPDMENRYNEFDNAVEALQGSGIKGLYYTVQVGAFREPLKTGQLNVAPLVYFEVGNLWKYTTGVFTSVEAANTRKDEVRNGPVPDAFVVPYYEGERITNARARELIEEFGDAIFTGSEELSADANSGGQPTSDYKTEELDGLTFHIFLGKFADEVPQDFGLVMLENGDEIDREENENFETVFQTKKVYTLAEAEERLKYYESKGIESAQIIPEYKFDEIELEEVPGLFYSEGNSTDPGDNDDTVTPPNNGGTSDDDTSSDDDDNTPRLVFGSDDDSDDDGEESRTAHPVDGLVFKVFLGKFIDDVPQNFSEVMLRNSDKGVKSEETENFETIYYAGDFETHDEAQQIAEFFFSEGVEDVEVVSFFYGEAIDLQEAIDKTYE